MKIERLWIATLTHHKFGSGDPQSSDSKYLSIEVGGREVYRTRITDKSDGGFSRGRANIFDIRPDGLDLSIDQLNSSSVRLGVEGNDAWQPSNVFVWAEAPRYILPRPFIYPLAFESDWDTTLSTDADEGPASAAVRLVNRGRQRMPIHRLVMITSQLPVPDNFETIDEDELLHGKLGLQVVARERLAAATMIGDTQQDATRKASGSYYATDDEPIVGRSNYYQPHVFVPFAKSEVGHGAITALKRGGDAWWPKHFFLFGLDSKFGRPTRIVPLCYLPDWGEQMDEPFPFDATTGEVAVPLPIVDEGIELDGFEFEAIRTIG